MLGRGLVLLYVVWLASLLANKTDNFPTSGSENVNDTNCRGETLHNLV